MISYQMSSDQSWKINKTAPNIGTENKFQHQKVGRSYLTEEWMEMDSKSNIIQFST